MLFPKFAIIRNFKRNNIFFIRNKKTFGLYQKSVTEKAAFDLQKGKDLSNEQVFWHSFVQRVAQRNFFRLNQFFKDREFRMISINYCQKGHFWTKTCGYFDH